MDKNRDSDNNLLETLTRGQKLIRRAFDLRGLARWLFLGCLVGVVAGAGAIAFHEALEALKTVSVHFLMGLPLGNARGESETIHMATAARVHYAWILALPAIGGLLSGLLVWKFAPEARGHGTDAAIASFHRQGGHIRKRVPLVKFMATALTMGSGGSGGAEGPIGQIGAGFGSFIATRLHLGTKEKRWLMVAGLAAGVGAIFRVPLAGAIFAAEVLYSKAEIETEVLIPACVCSIVAYCIYGLRMGFGHMFPVSGVAFTNPAELATYLVLALLVSGGALLFIWAFYGTEGLFRRLRLPFFLKPAIGGLATGATAVVLLLLVPDVRVGDVLSTGYGVLQDALSGPSGHVAAGLLMAVALGKIATTSMTIGSGGSAGVFGPSMVIGGTMGGAAGIMLHSWLPSIAPNPATYAVVGMAGFFAAAANTPLAAVILVTEMTGGYDLIVPAVWVCSISFLVCRRWTIFRSQVPSRINSPAHIGEYAFEMMGGVRVGEVFKANRRFVPVLPETPLSEVLRITSGTRQRVFPVATADGELLGTFQQAELLQALHDRPDNGGCAGDLMQPVSATPFQPVYVRESDPVSAAHRLMTRRGVDEVVVVSDDGSNRIAGILTAADVLLAYSRRLTDLSRDSGSDELLPPVVEKSGTDELEPEEISREASNRTGE